MFNIAGSMLESYLKKKERSGVPDTQYPKEWYTRDWLDYLPGYYYLNCML